MKRRSASFRPLLLPRTNQDSRVANFGDSKRCGAWIPSPTGGLHRRSHNTELQLSMPGCQWAKSQEGGWRRTMSLALQTMNDILWSPFAGIGYPLGGMRYQP